MRRSGTARVPLQAQRRRHRPDHPRRVAEARRAHRLREGPVLHVARRPQLRPQRRALRRRARSSSPARRSASARRREHAVWAIQQGGFDAVIAPSFSDIFRNNCTKNGLLPVVLPEAVVEALWEAIEADPSTQIVVDMERLQVEVPATGSSSRSRWTRRRSTASSTASTTSASPSPTPTRSRLRGQPPRLAALTQAQVGPPAYVLGCHRLRLPKVPAAQNDWAGRLAQILASAWNWVRSRRLGLFANTSTGGVDRQPQPALQDAHLGVLVVLDERDRPAVAPGAGRAAGAVQVVLGVLGRLVVDDRADVVDVDAAGGDVGGDEHRQLALGEARSARSRDGCGRSPWIAAALDAEVVRALVATRSHSRLVWQNTSDLAGCPGAIDADRPCPCPCGARRGTGGASCRRCRSPRRSPPRSGSVR